MSAGALAGLAPAIVQAHKAATGAMSDAVGHAVRAGQLLAQAKASLPHGDFGAFCASLPFAATTARGYMRLAALEPAKRQRVADMPLRAALLEICGSRASSTRAPLIPLGSFGVSMWRDACNSIRWFELHPCLWPDRTTIGLHYALAEVHESGTVTCDTSRRAVQMSVEQLVAAFDVPVGSISVFTGPPLLWTPEVSA